jgi:hypothetical protein
VTKKVVGVFVRFRALYHLLAEFVYQLLLDLEMDLQHLTVRISSKLFPVPTFAKSFVSVTSNAPDISVPQAIDHSELLVQNKLYYLKQ